MQDDEVNKSDKDYNDDKNSHDEDINVKDARKHFDT